MRKKNNEGSSLLEIVIAIAVLAAVVIPVCSSLVLSHKVNAKTEKLMQAQLEVSSIVETLMAKGIPADYHALVAMDPENIEDPDIVEEAIWWIEWHARYKETVDITRDNEDIPYYNIKVTSQVDEGVAVETTVRVTSAVLPQDPGQGGGGNA